MGRVSLLWRKSLYFRFMVGIVGLFVALYISVATYNYFAIKSGSLGAWKKAMTSQAKFITDSISSSLEVRRNMVQLLARNLGASLARPIRGGISSRLQTLHQSILHMDPDIAGIYVLSTDGRLLLRCGSEFKGSIARREFVKMAAKGFTWISSTSVDDGMPYIYYSSPILDEGGDVRAVLVLRYFATRFIVRLPLFEKGKTKEGFRVTIYDSRGVCIADSEDRSLLFTSIRPLPQEEMRRVVEEELYGSDIKSIRVFGPRKVWEIISQGKPSSNPFRYDGFGKSYLAIVSQVGPQKWYCLVSIPLRLIMSPTIRSIVGSAVFSAIVIAIGFLIGLYLARTVISPLKFLRDATIKLSEWDGSVPLPIEREDEIGELAKSFYAMRSSLISSHRELAERKEELETINQVASVANSSLNGEEIARGTLSRMIEVLGAKCGMIYVLDRQGKALRLLAANPVDMNPLKESLEIEESLLRDVSFFSPEEISRIPLLAPLREQHAFRAVGIPLKSKEGAIGLAIIGFREKGATDLLGKRGLFNAIGDVVGMALENAILHMESIRWAEIVGLRNRIARVVAGSLKVSEICSNFVEELFSAFSSHGIILGVIEGKSIKIMAVSPQEELKVMAEREWEIDSSAYRELFIRKPYIEKSDGISLCLPEEALRVCDAEYMVIFPIISKEKLLGLLTIFGRERLKIELDAIQPIVDHLAIALENAILYEETERLAIMDELTGLYNRRYFFSSLESEIIRAQRYGYPVSLLFLDLDFFKRYNDRYGHTVGDQLLRELGGILRKEIRTVDIPTRYGGEEFAVILPMTQKAGAISVAERIRKRVMGNPFCTGLIPSGTHITISIGVSSFPEDAKDADTLIRKADNALYKAKELGRNKVVAVD
jgi:diguanylate cyclase (GGDEF)-like protein